MNAQAYQPVWGELGVEISILNDFFRDHPVKVSPALARAGAEDGDYPWLCLRHTDLGLVTGAEFVAHLRAGHENNCVSCGASAVVPDGITRWRCDFTFPVRAKFPDGHIADGYFEGGSDVIWGPYAQRCMPCLQKGLVSFGDLQQHDQARRDQMRRDVHGNDARYVKE